jgi:sialic acid synthase SpsE
VGRFKMLRLGNKEIRQGGRPYTIAEAGVNHQGDLKNALNMIGVAKKAGVDAIKFQTYNTDEFCNPDSELYPVFKKCEFQRKDWQVIINKCYQEGITFLSTPQNESDLELLLQFGIPAIKVGSDDLTNYPLLKKYCKAKLPIILSCGMAKLGEINQALEIMDIFNNSQVILLLCTSLYPTPPNAVNLHRFKTLAREHPNLIVGFSDHTEGSLASSLATTYGATVFETHFTLNKSLEGPDHKFSKNPKELRIWVQNIHKSYMMLGTSEFEPSPEELEVRKIARRSVTAIKDISKGEHLTKQNIGLRRPENGIQPNMFISVLGSKAKRDIKKGKKLVWGDFHGTR